MIKNLANQSTKITKWDDTEERYHKKAIEKYNEKKYHQCLVYLRHVPLNERHVVSLFVKCCYEFWLETLNESNSNENLDLVLSAYETLISKCIPSMITAAEYLHLAHIYIAEANLVTALKILQLAANNGHSENKMLVFQSWPLLQRYGDILEADNAIFYVSSTIQLQNQSRNNVNSIVYFEESDIKLSHAYLICGNYLLKKSYITSNQMKKMKLFDDFKSLLTEAFVLEHKCVPLNFTEMFAWFNSSELWLKLADSISNTSYLLLAQECYIESFKRKLLSNQILLNLQNYLIKYKRYDNEFPDILESCYQLCPINIFCRNYLKVNSSEFKEYFAQQECFLVKIQAIFRGKFIRKNWKYLKNQLLLIHNNKFQMLKTCIKLMA